MNKVLLPLSVVKKIEELPDREREQLFAKLKQLQKQHDPIADSTRVPFREFDDVRMVQVGDYLLLFKFNAEKSEIYPVAISKM